MIHRQRFEVELAATADDAYAAQAALSAIFRDDVPRAIEPVLDDATRDGTHLRVDRLEVELEIGAGAGLREELLEQLRLALREALRHPPASPATGAAAQAPPSERLTPGTSEERLCEHLLETGALPWWAPAAEPQSLAPRLERLLESGRLVPLLRRGERARRIARLFASFPHIARHAARLVAAEEAGAELVQGLAAAAAAVPPAVQSAVWSRAVDSALLLEHVEATALPRRTPDQHAHAVVARALASLSLAPSAAPATRHERAAAGASTSVRDGSRRATRPAPAPERSSPVSPAPAAAAEAEPRSTVRPRREPGHSVTPPRRSGAEAARSPPPPAMPAIAEPAPPALAESLPVDDAGLVLLHPFLKTFFSAAGLLTEGVFTDEVARGRAVCLLRWLATGEPVTEEHRLVLAKLLCGLPLEFVVEPFGEPTDAEREEGEAVLVHAASLWPALRSRSPRLLRDMFLKRGGVLSRNGPGWELRLEPRGWDVLLGQLPWGFSHVRLGWMPGLLAVLR